MQRSYERTKEFLFLHNVNIKPQINCFRFPMNAQYNSF